MDKSVEAYNILLKAWQGNKEAKDYPNFDDINEALDTIYQAVKRLEKIENLRTTPNALETCLAKYMNKCIELEKEYSNLQNDYDNKDFECIDLLKENQELKEKIEISQKANKELSFTSNAYAKAQKPYIEKIQKLEKAIEILKKYLFLADEKSLVWQKGYEHSTNVSDDDYDFLKEVFRNGGE